MEPCRLCHRKLAAIFATVKNRDYYLCPQCGGISLAYHQLPKIQDEHARYLLHQNNVDDPAYVRFLYRLLNPLNPYLNSQQNILDFGAGPVPVLAHLLAKKNLNITIYDPLFFPRPNLANETYDVIIVCEVAEHFSNPGKEFALLQALLRPGGRIGLMTSIFRPDIQFENWHYVRDFTHVFFYQNKTFAWIAQQYQFHFSSPRNNIIFLQKINSRIDDQ